MKDRKRIEIRPKDDWDFMGVRWYCLGISFALIVTSLVLFVRPGILWGTDFKGGTEIEIEFKKPVEPGVVRQHIQALGFASPEVVQAGGSTSHYLVKVQETSNIAEAAQAQVSKALCLLPEEGELNDPACPKPLQTEEVKFSPGGDKITARYVQSPCVDEKAETCELRPELAAQLSGKVEGVTMRTGSSPAVVVQNIREHKVEFLLQSRGDQIMAGLSQKLGQDVVPEFASRVEWIGPKAGSQLRNAAIISVSLAMLFIMAYIGFRFDMRFAPGGVVALFHDVLIAVGAMTAARLEFTLSTVAALLTIVGYSIADTVVVYDRIRENLGKHRKMSFPRVVNRSITEMFRRTIRTSATTLVAISPFLIFGTSVIQDFAFCMCIGIVVGTYSSIYVAAPVTEWIDRRFFHKLTAQKQRRAGRKIAGAPVPEYRQGDAVI